MTDLPEARARLAVVVVSYNVRELLRACLKATYAGLGLSPELSVTVIVVDNASADGSAAMVAQEFPQARLEALAENLGFAGGNNRALRLLGFGELGKSDPTAPDLVLLLNPDAEPIGDAIGSMARYLMAYPRVGGAGAQLQFPDGSFQHGAFRFPGLMQLWFDLFPPRPRRLLESSLNGRYARRAYEVGQPFAVDFALGAALMVRREAVEAAGMLDEGYFMYGEEVDWCWRIQRAGFPFACVPAARVIHHGGASASQFRARSFLNLWRSRRRLYGRFYGSIWRRLAGWIVRLGMGAEARRVEAASRLGEIDEAEKTERLDAIDGVLALFAKI